MSPKKHVESLQRSNYFGGTIETYIGLQDSQFIKLLKTDDYAPLYMSASAVSLHLLGKDYNLMLLSVNSFFYILTALFIFLITKHLSSDFYGAIAVITYSLFPAAYEYSRLHVLDNAVIPAVLFAIYCLLRSKLFSIKKWTLAFGLACGIGMMCKNSFIAFLLGPTIYTFFSIFKTGHLKKRAITIVIAGFLSLLVMAPHYSQSKSVKKLISDSQEEPDGKWYEPHNLSVYTIGIVKHQISLLWFVALIIFGIRFFIFHKNKYSSKILFLWFLVPLLILIFMPHGKNTTYMLPYLPVYAIVIALGMKGSSKLPVFSYLIFFILGIILFSEISFAESSHFSDFLGYEQIEEIKNYDKLRYYCLEELDQACRHRKKCFLLPSRHTYLHPQTMTSAAFFNNTLNNIILGDPLDFFKIFNKNANFNSMLEYDSLVYAGTYSPSGKTFISDEIFPSVNIELVFPSNEVKQFRNKELFDLNNMDIKWKTFIENYQLIQQISVSSDLYVYIYYKADTLD